MSVADAESVELEERVEEPEMDRVSDMVSCSVNDADAVLVSENVAEALTVSVVVNS